VDQGPGSLFEAVFTSSPDAVVLVDGAGCIELASAAVEALFGYEPSELVGQPIEILVPDQVREAHREHRRDYAMMPAARPMGVSLQLQGRRRDGTVFPIDVSLSPLVFDQRSRTVAFVRDVTDRRRGDRLMEYINEVTRSVLAGEDITDVLELVSERARALAGAAVTWVVVPDPSDPHRLTVVAGAGPDVEEIVGATLDASSSLSAKAMGAGQPVLVPDMHDEPAVVQEAREAGFGPGVYFPMVTADGPMGAVVAARRRAASAFTDAEVAATEAFASAAAVGLALGAARESLENLRMVSEQERIARDLHDTVIQRLFGLGMGLQAAQRLADEPLAERVHVAVEAIDEVIREIRETIFDLNRPPAAGLDVRSRVRAVAAEANGPLGFSPRVSIRGPVEAALTEPVLVQLLSVLREGLSNVARHAHASRVDVVVLADSRLVTLTVADDGIGLPDGPLAGHGLENMTKRAAKLGGECAVTRRSPAGTILRWRVPLARR
jgi:PAS domain S-box-containing protein